MPLQVRRNYGSHNLANNQLGYGWKLNYMPYLTVVPASNIVYEAEVDGSVFAFGPAGTDLWRPRSHSTPRSTTTAPAYRLGCQSPQRPAGQTRCQQHQHLGT